MTETAFHPGPYLQELLLWRDTSPEELASITGIPRSKIIDVTTKRRGIDKYMSESLAIYFGNSAQYWLDLQELYDQGKKN
jgi:addiction module HigA family antidote